MFGLAPLPRTLAASQRDFASAESAVRRAALADLSLPTRAPGDDADRAARIALLLLGTRDLDASVRKQAAVGLADLGAIEARPALLSLLSDPEIEVRQMAVLALGEVTEAEDAEVEGRLHLLLGAGDARIRYQALSALVQLRPLEAAPRVTRALRDEDPEVRQLAARLAEEYELLDRDPGPLGQALVRAASDPAPHVALLAQLALAERGIAAPVSRIEEVVGERLRVREPRDTQRAIDSAGALGLRNLSAALERRAFGFLGYSFDPFRFRARAALARLGSERAHRAIERALHGRSFSTRTLAVEAAGMTRDARYLEPLSALSRRAATRGATVDEAVLATALARLAGGAELGTSNAPPSSG